jgi:beta-lactamase regulating signal transducer with metallopeptidase domain
MDAFLNTCIAGVNDIGRGFCIHAAGVFVQSGVLIVVLLSIDLLLRSRIRATLRYWIWMLVIVKLLLPPTFSLPTGVGHWLGGYVALSSPIARQVLDAAGPRETPGQAVPPETTARTSAPSVPRSNASVAAAKAEPVEPIAVRSERLTWQGGAVLLWGVGVVGFIGLVMRRAFFVRRLVAQGRPAQGDPVDVLDECRRRMNIHRQVRMKLLSGAFSPAVCGLWRPAILLPEALLTRLAPDNLRAVLIHELAHIKRADLWVNCLQTILQIIYFYNPLVWLANAIVRCVREQAVDEMSLVALGAEARSYGNTLIDIAEMAFGRANPALRLVGVAESKKSLEGRIRHMTTRPIPRSARVGVVGIFAVVALGAVTLPMAGAKTETPAGEFTARLSNGATVTLAGVCRWPAQEPVCWKPDGSSLDRDIRPARWSQLPDARDYGFMVQVTGPNTPELSWNRIAGAKAGTRACDVVDRRSKSVPGFQAVIASVENASVETTIRLGVAAGPWKTIFTHNGSGMKAVAGQEGILWSQAFEDSEGTHIIASTPWYTDRVKRVVAVDAQGVLHTDAQSSSVASGNVGQMTGAVFQGLRRDSIKEFQFQVRPYEWIEFTGVSLQQGHKTTVGINVRTLENEIQNPAASVAELRTKPGDAFRVYAVNRNVADFPSAEDLSTPEAAYATINRIARDDPSAWQKVSIASLAERLAQESRQRQTTADPEWARVLLNARIRDVIVWKDTQAAVIAELPQGLSSKKVVASIDVRYFQRENGRWLNAGNNRFVTVEQAESDFMARFDRPEPTAAEAQKVDPVTVMGHLKQLALAASLYAEDHEGRYAPDLTELKPYLGDDTRFAQIMENVVYLGKGVKRDGVASPAAQPLAYWKTATATDGIAVAFFDGHAEVVKGDRLTKLGIVMSVPAAAPRSGPQGAVRTYEVNRSVADFPPTEDMSTPEAAYATINRMDRDDPSAWQKVSVAALAGRLAQHTPVGKTTANAEWAKVLSNARIREVLVWNMTRAAAIAELPQEPSGKKIVDPIDVRHLQLENGRWLNIGNSRFRSIEEAKTQFMGRIERETTVPEALRDPLRHAGEIKEAAAHLFERLRTADYADILPYYRDGKWDPEGLRKFPTDGLYQVYTDYPSFALWCCTHFKDNPIIDVQLGDVFIGDALVSDKTGWPAVPYKLTLKDGSILAGNLPFNYSVDQGRGHWHAMEGIDWHRWPSRTR